MIKKDMPKKVFFLGAGFSKAVNGFYPLLKRNPDSLKSTSLGLTERVLLQFEEKYGNTPLAKHLNELPESLNDNIEELLTFLNTDFPWKSEIQKKQDEALYECLTKEIVEVIDTIDKKKNPNKMHYLFDDNLEQDNINPIELIRYINTNRYPVITLNYDTLFEELTLNNYSNGKCKYSDLYQMPIMDIKNRLGNGYLTDWNDDTIKCSHLLKLHGSVNWLFSKMSKTLYYEHNLPQNLQYLKEDLIPYIIPPILDKNNLYNHQLIKILWRKAHEYLSNAEEIYIIGFSLPKTDISVKFLFQSALKNSNAKTYLINVSSEKDLADNFYNLYAIKNPKMYKVNSRLSLIDYAYCGIDKPIEKFINEKILIDKNVNV